MTTVSGAVARGRTRRPANGPDLNPAPGRDTGAVDDGLPLPRSRPTPRSAHRRDTGAVDDRLPLVHRLAVAYLAAPVAVWLVGWFRWWFGIPVAALLAAGLWRALSGPWPTRRPTLRMPVLMLVALAWVMLTPVGGLAAIDGADWLGHRAQLLDLARGGWPTYPTDWLNDQSPLISFYLGWHMVPALMGQWLGAAALNWAVPLWTWAGVVLVLALFTRGLPTLRAMSLAAAVLIFFSGMDMVEYALFEGLPDAIRLLRDRVGLHLIFISSPSSPVLLEYQSNALTFRYSPHHFLTGGLGLLLILQLRHHRRFMAVSGLVLAVCLFWSPTVCIGLMPLAAVLIAKKGIRPFLKWPNLLVAPLLTVLLALYLTSGRDELFFAWLWERYDNLTQMALDLFIVYLGEFLLLAILLWRMNRQLNQDPFFMTSIAVLLLAPWFVYGDSYISALTLRTSVPALLLLCWYAARATTSRLPEMDGHPGTITNASSKLYITLLVMLGIGAVSAVFVFMSILRDFGDKHYEQTATSYQQTPTYFMIENSPRQITEKVTYQTPGLIKQLLKTNQPGGRGELLFSNNYDVYLTDENRLVYVNRDCQPSDEDDTSFLLHIYPTDPNDLPASLRADGYEALNFIWRTIYYKDNTDCVAGSPKLPSYDIARIVTGQHRPAQGMIWQVEYNFDSASATEITDYNYSWQDPNMTSQLDKGTIDSTFDWIATQEPLIDSVFDVYLSDGRIIYAKQPCRSSDTEPFFLHIFPDNLDDLPDHRTTDFDNYDFEFADRGVVSDDRCLAVVNLPSYGIARIRTGQFDREQDRNLWLQEAAVSR